MSAEALAEAARFIPGGVNSPVRSFAAVGGAPVFFVRGSGATLYDADGRAYLDYVGAWGPAIAGHAHPEVLRAVRKAAADGLGFGAPHPLETEMARTLCARIASVERVRMVNSGTEAAMSALRLARAATGRDRILKFAGCYHGHADALLVQAGSGALTHGSPSSPGVPADTARHTQALDYNDADAVRQAFDAHGAQIAAVIVEPIAGNMGCVPPAPSFLETLRACCDAHGAVLIFDEVMTGFRVGPGGAQESLGVAPDLTVLGKIIGGGLPVGAFGGRADLMEQLAPSGPVYQAGTLSGNPVAMAAGLAALRIIGREGFHAVLEQRTRALADGLRSAATEAGVALECPWVCGMFGLFFTAAGPVRNLADAQACRADAYRTFFRAMLRAGVSLAPSPHESGFVSSVHTEADIARTLEAARGALRAVAAQG